MNVQSNGKTTAGGITGRGFRPGESGNPGGRPKGLAALVREKTNDGKFLVEQMMKLARGQSIIKGTKPKHSDVTAAVEWLADRGFGRCLTSIALQHSDGSGLYQGTAEQASVTDLRAELIRRGALDANGRLIQQQQP
jgi:hypothetical protein